MAQKVYLRLVDDLDGSVAEGTVRFALDGAEYEIDLNAKHAETLRKALALYVEAARKASGSDERRRMRTGAARERTAQIREWAKVRGYEINERGRIPARIIQEYEAEVGSRVRIPSGRPRQGFASVQAGHEADIINLRTADEITIDVYLDTDDEAVTSAAFAALDDLARALGIEDMTPGGSWHGSIFTRFKGTIPSTPSERSVEERLLALERLLKSSGVNLRDPRQAGEDKAISTALSQLFNSLVDVPRVCIRYGPLLVVKYPDDSGESVLLGRELSQSEREILEEHPELLKRPETVLDVLSLALSEQVIEE